MEIGIQPNPISIRTPRCCWPLYLFRPSNLNWDILFLSRVFGFLSCGGNVKSVDSLGKGCWWRMMSFDGWQLVMQLTPRFVFSLSTLLSVSSSILGIRSGACTQLSLSLYTCRACWKRTRLDRTSPCGTTLWIDFGIWTIWHYVIWWASTLSLESIVEVDG